MRIGSTSHVVTLKCFHDCRMNRLSALPRGFGAFPVLEVLDLTYNNLNENSLPPNFFQLGIYLRTCNNTYHSLVTS